MPVNSRHPDMIGGLAAKWKRCRDAFDGADAVKAARTDYLPMLTGFTDMQKRDLAYDAYLYRAPYFNHVHPTTTSLTGAVFIKPMNREKILAAIEKQLEDVTLQAQTLEQVSRDMVGQVLLMGRYGVLIDMPGADVPAEARRPYWVLYRAEQIVNWRTIAINGKQVTVMVVLEEKNRIPNAEDPFMLDEVTQYRVLSLRPRGRGWQYQVNIWTEAPDKKGEWFEGPALFPMRRQEPIPFIPFVVVGPEGTTWDMSDPPMMPIIDASFSLYLTAADKEWGEHISALPTPYITGADMDKPVHLGSSEALVLTNPNSKLGFMEFSGAGLASLRDSIKEKTELIASLGARMLERTSQPATATEVKLRHAGEHATLSGVAQSCSQALSKAIQIHQWWAAGAGELDEGVKVALNTDFVAVDISPEEVRAVMELHQAGEISFETMFYRLQKGGFYAPGTTMEEERERIQSEKEDAMAEAQLIGGDPNADIEDDPTLPEEERERRQGLRMERDRQQPPPPIEEE